MRKILFQHIPKTGGTALITHAERYFGSATCPARYESELTDDIIRAPSYTFYHGHFSRSAVLNFRRLCPESFVFTFVRHPFTRCLSHYYNWMDPARVHHELDVMTARLVDADRVAALRHKFERTILKLSLDDFLGSDDPDIDVATCNLQAQHVTGVEFPNHLRFNKTAYNAITTYDFIGLQELYAPCLRIIELLCDLPAGALGGKERVNCNDLVKVSGKYVVTGAQFQRLESKSTYDLVLFHLAHALLLKSYGTLLPSAASDVDALADLPVVDDHRAATAYRAFANADAC